MLRPLQPPPVPDRTDLSLFLDFDGTLVDIAEHPAAIQVPPALPGLLAALRERLHGRVAIVSGRAVADLAGFIAAPELTVSGSHGAEIAHVGGKLSVAPVPGALDAARRQLAAFADAHAGVLVETKPIGVALHYRQAAALEAEAIALAAGLGEAHGLRVRRGKMVVELLPPGFDKGRALAAIMDTATFRRSRPVFVGDDLTDEDGFEGAAGHGGFGVLVGAHRDTAARYRLPELGAVRDWLRTVAEGPA